MVLKKTFLLLVSVKIAPLLDQRKTSMRFDKHHSGGEKGKRSKRRLSKTRIPASRNSGIPGQRKGRKSKIDRVEFLEDDSS